VRDALIAVCFAHATKKVISRKLAIDAPPNLQKKATTAAKTVLPLPHFHSTSQPTVNLVPNAQLAMTEDQRAEKT
jgi:hypothetical protein